MLKSLALASALGLALAAPARAETSVVQHDTTVTTTTRHSLPDDVVAVETNRPSPGGVILRDAVGGAVLGTAVGGGGALYSRYVQNGSNGDWGNWQRDLALGAGIGLAAGLVLGVVDAASSSSGPAASVAHPVTDRRETGFSAYQPVYGMKF